MLELDVNKTVLLQQQVWHLFNSSAAVWDGKRN